MIIKDSVYKLTNVVLFFSFIIYAFFFRYFGDVKIAVIAMSSWIALSFICIQNKINIKNIYTINFLTSRTNLALIFLFKTLAPHILFIVFYIIFANEIRKTPGMPIVNLMNILSMIFFVCVLQLRYFNNKSKQESFNIVIEFSIYYILFLGILTGHTVRDSIHSHILFYSCIGAVSSYFLASQNLFYSKIISIITKRLPEFLKNLDNTSKKNFLIYLIFIVLFLFFSFRTDILEYSSPVLHWAYYTGPTYEIGFQNIFSTLSQYSLMFNLLASKISPNPHFSVWLGQAILLNLIFLMGIFMCRKIKYAFIVLLSLAILILFVDPSSVGPQAYPSSSVVRFFPFYLMVFAYTIISDDPNSIKSKSILIFSIIIAILWSSLSLLSLITSLIMLVTLRLIVNFSNYNNYKDKLINCFKEVKLHFLLIILTLIIIIFLISNTHIFDFQFYYVSTNYGWASSGSIWVIAPLLFATAIITRSMLIKKDPYIFLLAMPLIAAFAYYSYRPLSHNITAVTPLIFFTLLAMQTSVKQKKDTDEVSKKNIIGERLLKNISIGFIILALVSFTFQIPNKKESPFSIINITKNNLNGLSNAFFSIPNPEEICRDNEKNYKYFLENFYNKYKNYVKTDIPFIVLADFDEVSSFGSCFMDDKNNSIQRRIFYSSALYNPPLPKNYSKKLIDNYISRHNIKEFFVLTSNHNKYAKIAFNDFISQLPEKFKMQKIDNPLAYSKYINGAENIDISLELMYFGSRIFK